jgi:hypothetical protein
MRNEIKKIYETQFKPAYEAGNVEEMNRLVMDNPMLIGELNGREYKLIFAVQLNRTLGDKAIDIGRLVREGAK